MTHRYAVLIGAAGRGSYYRRDLRKKDQKMRDCPDLIRYSDLGDALIDWVSLPPATRRQTAQHVTLPSPRKSAGTMRTVLRAHGSPRRPNFQLADWSKIGR